MPQSGKPQKTTIQVDRIIRRKSTDDPSKTANDTAHEFWEENLADDSCVTISRCLLDVGHFGRVALKKPFIR